jgi:hypothetical protein
VPLSIHKLASKSFATADSEIGTKITLLSIYKSLATNYVAVDS